MLPWAGLGVVLQGELMLLEFEVELSQFQRELLEKGAFSFHPGRAVIFGTEDFREGSDIVDQEESRQGLVD